MTLCLNGKCAGGKEVVILGQDGSPWRKDHSLPCHAKAVARPLSPSGKMGPHVLGVLADRDTGRRRVCYTTDNRPKVSTRASKTDQIRPQMSQRISLLIHDLKLCQQSKQINKFRETLGVAVATAGSWKSARKFLKASLLLLSCY